MNNIAEQARWLKVGCVWLSIWACAFLGKDSCSVTAQEPPPEQRATSQTPLRFNQDIRPILAENCLTCHGLDSIARQADLRLDVREAAMEMGAIVPGEPDNSELIARIETDDADLLMPPADSKKQLSAQQRDLLRRWISEGATYDKHWALIAPETPAVPALADANWCKNEIDAFVLHDLKLSGLTPAEELEPRLLFRRLSLDIRGLPPEPGECDQFVADYATHGDEGLARWIDQLMNSPAWGEHRARYWLDAVRYADTHGMHFDNYREMWPYRDWVIRAFNQNQPFDQFTVEQLAGDLLEQPTLDQLVATGLQRCAMTTNEGGTIAEENLALYAADRVQTFGWVYLGLTTNCAQCHDHKFDPISTKDYYSLAAFFRNTTQGALDGNSKDGRGPVIRVPQPADQERWNVIDAEIAAAKQARDDRRASASESFNAWLAATLPQTIRDAIPLAGRLVSLPLNEGQGKPLTAGGAGVELVATGELHWLSEGRWGPAIQLKPGATLELGALGDFGKQQAWSHAEWIRASQTGPGAGIIARMDEQNQHRGWDLFIADGRLSMHIIQSWPDNAIKVTTQQPVIEKDKWQHVCVSWDGSGKPEGIRIYVDGQLQPTKTDNHTLSDDADVRTATPLRIGQRSQAAVFDGSVQDFCLYDRLLSPSEVHALANTEGLARALETPAEQRSDEQQQLLLEVYLNQHDSEFIERTAKVAQLEAERSAIEARSPITHVQVEREGQPAMANILMRGEYDKVGQEVAAATPTALHPLPANAPANRLGLAQWVIDPANPLTARVTVNRFWQQIFGQGIVITSEDFGVMGAKPSHPELLDWLATDFVAHGWDVKRLFKQILMSATYRQAATVTPEKLERDRDNLLLSRGPRFRMDAEMVRDSALAVSGLLSAQMFGAGVRPYQPSDIWNVVGLPGGDTREYVTDQGENLYRRSLYTFWKRMAPPPNLEAFNAPSREVCTVRRERTNTPLQALVTLNDAQFVEAARHLAQLAIEIGGSDDSAVLTAVTQRALGRSFLAEESAIAMATHAELLAYYQQHPEDAQALLAVGQSAVDEQLDPARLAAWTMTCNQIMNLDEVLNK